MILWFGIWSNLICAVLLLSVVFTYVSELNSVASEKCLCGMTAAERMFHSPSSLIFSRPAGTCVHDSWAEWKWLDSWVLSSALAFCHLYYILLANQVTQPAHIQEMEKATALLDGEKSKATLKGHEHKRTEGSRPVFQSAIPHWKMNFVMRSFSW